MKKLILLLVTIAFSIFGFSQKTLELKSIPIAKAGSMDITYHTVQPLNTDVSTLSYDSLNMSYAGGWSFGQSFCMESSPTGDTIFIGAGAGIIIMDATDPYNPVLLSEIHARALIDAVYYEPSEGRLYLAAYFSGLEIWDVEDMTSPYRISRAAVTGLPRSGVYEKWNDDEIYCFLATVADGIHMFNVTNAANPIFVGNFPVTSLVWGSEFNGTHLFLTKANSGTQILEGFDNIPSLTSYGVISTPTTDIALDGNYAYIINSASGLKIYDWSNLPAMLTGQLPITGYPYKISKWNNLAYIANSTTNPGGGINILDLGDPANPAELGYYNSPCTYITGNGHAVYATGGQDGCVMMDVTDPENPVYASNYKLPVSENDIAVRDNFAYTGNNGFRVFDISDKSHPIQVGYEETDGALVKLYGNHAVYCPKSMGSGNKVNIMDISDPANPVKVGQYNAPVMTYDLDLKGHFAYVSCWWDGIRVVDFSNPESPVLSAHVMGWVNGAVPGEEWFYCQALDVEGDYLYAIDYGPFPDEDTRGVYIFDIADPGSPILVKRLADYQGTPYDIEVSNGYAYLADNAGGLSVVSVQDPFSPIQTSYLPLGDAAWAVDVFANYAFVANYINEGVQVIDISIPSMPTVAGYYKRTGCFALNVTYDAGYVYVADGPAGIQIYNFDLLSGIHSTSADDLQFEVYPNPAKDILYITSIFDQKASVNFSIVDLNGSVLKQGEVNILHQQKSAIDVGNLPHGLYFLKLTTGDKVSVSKVIID